MTRTAYQKWYKMLKPHQKVMQVPGLFGWNQTQCSLKTQTAALLDKLRGFWAWAQEDPKVVGLSPWHLNDRSSGMGANMGRGAIEFPSVLAELRAIMKLIDGS